MPWRAGIKPVHAFISNLARWSLEVDIDKYHDLIPVFCLGLTVFGKIQCQNNTDKQIMMNEGNTCLPPSVITFPPHSSEGGKPFTWEGAKKISRFSL